MAAVAGNQVALGGGVAPKWRALKTEAALAAGASAAEAAKAELADAEDLGRNGFKITLTARLAAAAITQAQGGEA